jgi:riboflavin-specific deaminase-like protein
VWLQVHRSGRWQSSAAATPEAADVMEIYVPLLLRADVVIGQVGQSLDGRIATESGHSHYVTGPADIRRVHRLRALVDAVVVGARTIALDNPRLTVREVEGRNPVRVILDPDGRLGPDRHVFSDGAARTLVVRRQRDEGPGPSSAGNVLTIPVRENDGFDPRVVLEMLREVGYRRVLIEGGGITVSRFVQAGVLDRLHVTVAPLLIGSGRPALTLATIQSLDQALRPPCRHFRLGEDILFDLDLRTGAPAE